MSEEYLFIGGQEDGNFIETPGLPHHEVAVAELPPRAGESSWKPQPRITYHRRLMLIEGLMTYAYVIDGMSDSEAYEQLERLKGEKP